VQDVFTHMASTFQLLAAPGTLDGGTSPDAEENAEVPVQARRQWSSSDVVEAYEHWSTAGIAGLTAMQESPTAETVVPLGNLGRHPLHLLANALVFDHYCHLRHDVVEPGGPVQRAPLPSDDLRLRPTLTWMLAGLPQMCAERLSIVDRPVLLTFDGPGGGRWVMRPSADDGLVVIEQGTDDSVAAAVTSAAHDFVQWGTKRRDWRACNVRVEGDEAYASRVLDAVNVI
jgi:hypothetical protein